MSIDTSRSPTSRETSLLRVGSLPDKLVVKPNFVVADQPERSGASDQLLFVGRLSLEKGVRTLLAAQSIHQRELRIAGDGPLREEVDQRTDDDLSLRLLGQLDHASVRREMLCRTRALVFPSEWYEGFPVTIAEAFASGLPVIASRLGAMAEIVEDGVTGMLFEPGSADDLARKMTWAVEHPVEMEEMGKRAREEYEQKYTPEINYKLLMGIYEEAIREMLSLTSSFVARTDPRVGGDSNVSHLPQERLQLYARIPLRRQRLSKSPVAE